MSLQDELMRRNSTLRSERRAKAKWFDKRDKAIEYLPNKIIYDTVDYHDDVRKLVEEANERSSNKPQN